MDAALDLKSARMEKAADEGEVVIHNVSELFINDELELAGTDSEQEIEDASLAKRKGKQTARGHRGKTSSKAAAAKNRATPAACGGTVWLLLPVVKNLWKKSLLHIDDSHPFHFISFARPDA